MTLSSFIICTKDRPDDLFECLTSIAQQTLLPNEVIIVDASRTARYEQNRTNIAALQPCTCIIHIRSDVANRSVQRNNGVQQAIGEYIFFFDDDVILSPDYHAVMQRAFTENPAIGGFQGNVYRGYTTSRFWRLHKMLFFPDWGQAHITQRMHPSGYNILRPFDTSKPYASAEWMTSCCASFRREIFTHFQFNPALHNCEDVDFSYRVSRHYRLLVVRNANIVHKESPVAREDWHDIEAQRMINFYYLFRKNQPQDALHWLAYLWATLGKLLGSLRLITTQRDSTQLRGQLKGIQQILRGNVPYNSDS